VKLALPPAFIYEWRRSRSTRSTIWLLALIVASAISTGVNELANGVDGGFLSGAVGHVSAAGPVAAILGAMAIGTEFRWNTIRQLFITFPRRYVILAAKIGVIAGLVAAASLLGSVVGTAFGVVSGDAVGSIPDWLGLSLRAMLVLIGWAVIAFGLAGLGKSTIVGVAVPIAVAFLVEVALLQVAPDGLLTAVLPFVNASEALSLQVPVGEAFEHLAVFWAWVLLSLGACLFVLGRRDA